MRIRFAPEADEELAGAVDYLSERSSVAAQRFLADVDETLQLLVRFPRLGTPLHRGLRRFLLKIFPYRLIYGVDGEEVVVYAVAHVRRKPGYWRKRIPN